MLDSAATCQSEGGASVIAAAARAELALACFGSTFVPDLSLGYLHTQLSVLFGRCFKGVVGVADRYVVSSGTVLLRRFDELDQTGGSDPSVISGDAEGSSSGGWDRSPGGSRPDRCSRRRRG